jgi:Mrp family chromosome partitioning ATPase/uncharacterized protein involved in exopolysaccharide biosynthesis
MDQELQVSSPEAPKKLPFDLRAVAIGLLRRLPILILCIAASGYLGIREGKKLGKKTYKSETLAHYERHGEVRPETDEKTTLLTLKDTVKTEDNLRAVKKRLGLPDKTEVIGKALDVEVQKNTTLLSITATWKSAQGAADLANTLRDVFLATYRHNVKAAFQEQVRDLQRRLDEVRGELKSSDTSLQQFTSLNKVIDIDKQSRALLEEANSMSVLLEQAQAERKTVEEQSSKLERVIAELKVRVAKEQASSASIESLSDLNIRIGKLKEAIREDKEYRANVTEMNLRQQEMERAKTLQQMGAISQQDYQRAVATYEKARIAAQDTDQIKAWKAELDRLQKAVIPQQGVSAPSGPILQEMLVRTFDIQLQRVAVQEKVFSLQQALTRVKSQLQQMPMLQRQYDALSRNVVTLETERKGIEDRQAMMQRASEAETPDFVLVTAAEPETTPVSSSGKMIAIGIGAGGLFLGLGLMVILELLDTTVRTGKEIDLRLKLTPLGALPRRRRAALFPTTRETRLSERFTVLAQKVRKAVPAQGAHLLLVSATAGEGAATLGANLAACYGRQGEQVLLVDALAEGRERHVLRELLANKDADFTGFDDYLQGRTNEIDSLPQETDAPGVRAMSRAGKPFSPDRLSANRTAEMYRELSRHYSLIITVASPVQSSIEAQILARYADAVIMVARSRRVRGATLRRVLSKIQEAGTPVVGGILTGVSRLYMTKE